ncbi:hypothetical protein E0198_002406 [Clavispora lusitaniae]|nr:hypothetical protein E0198_002406 [Clavispora lusitaniae]
MNFNATHNKRNVMTDEVIDICEVLYGGAHHFYREMRHNPPETTPFILSSQKPCSHCSRRKGRNREKEEEQAEEEDEEQLEEEEEEQEDKEEEEEEEEEREEEEVKEERGEE